MSFCYFSSVTKKTFSRKHIEYRSHAQGTMYAVGFCVPKFLFGILNPDVRCYLNVGLILLWKIPLLRKMTSQNNSDVCIAIRQILESLDAQVGATSTDNLKRALGKLKRWRDGQQDAAQFIYKLLDLIEADDDIGISYRYAYFYRGKQVTNVTEDREKGMFV